MEEDEKTEEPTPKRISEAREEGNVASCQDVTSSASLLIGVLVIWAGGPLLFEGMSDHMRSTFASMANPAMGEADIHRLFLDSVLSFSLFVIPFLLLFVVVSLVVKIVVSGWNLTFKPLVPKLSKVFSISNVKRFVSMHMWMELLKAVTRIVIAGLIAWLVLHETIGIWVEAASWSFLAQAQFVGATAYEVLWKMAVVLLVLGFADYAWQHRQWRRRLRMTVQEVKDEARQADGDPAVKMRIRRIRMEMHRRFMMHEVPRATVVVTNPTHVAVALRYRRGEDRAPVVVAKGRDLVALRIREVARSSQVPLHENPPLARALESRAEIGESIPDDLFAAVAEILAFVMTGRSPRAA